MTNIELRILSDKDVTQSYVDWFSNPLVTQFSDNRYRKFTLGGQIEYVKKILKVSNQHLFGIFESKEHIGNIVLGPIDLNHRRAEITYVIGSKSHWGKGIGTYAVREIVKKARRDYDLIKVFAGCASHNEGSKKILLKNGFVLEGVRKKHLFYDGIWMDQLDYGLILGD